MTCVTMSTTIKFNLGDGWSYFARSVTKKLIK